MFRTLDPSPFNRIANHPDVLPWLGVEGAADLTPLVSNPDNICLLTDEADGGYILHRRDHGLYEAHSMAVPEARGKRMLQLMREGFAFMFTATDAVEIATFCPDGNLAADRWGQIAGFREQYRREGVFLHDGIRVGGSYRSLTYQDWVLKDRDNLHVGQGFHAMLAASGFEPEHADDPVHDHWVGATIKGCIAGQSVKAVALYNRWASVAGYLPARLLATAPPVVDIATCVLGLGPQGPRVLRGPIRVQAEGHATFSHSERTSCRSASA